MSTQELSVLRPHLTATAGRGNAFGHFLSCPLPTDDAVGLFLLVFGLSSRLLELPSFLNLILRPFPFHPEPSRTPAALRPYL